MWREGSPGLGRVRTEGRGEGRRDSKGRAGPSLPWGSTEPQTPSRDRAEEAGHHQGIA